MSFLAPERLLLFLALAALVVAYVVLQRRRTRFAARFTNLALLDKVAPTRPGWRRHLPAFAFALTVGLLVTGFAKPTADIRVPREQATIMVAVDVSTSMEAEDVDPNRLDAAKRAATAFVEQLPERFNVGLVSFSGSASVVVAPTTNRQDVRNGIDGLTLGPRTAIGEGVVTSLSAITSFGAQFGESTPPARIVLLSDGTNTAGRSPEEAAERAAAVGVPVSTIAYGTAEGFILQDGQQVPVPVDGPALEELAETTGGRYYEAASSDELQTVYEDIGSSIGYRIEEREVSAWFAGIALLFACLAGVGSLLWFSRLP